MKEDIKDFGLRCASETDIEDIMKLEFGGFVQGIRETRETILQRINNFPKGFQLLFNKKSNDICGYLCSEIWNLYGKVDPNMFMLGHDISHYHQLTGNTIYISSMTILQARRSAGLGSFLFHESVKFLKNKFPDVKNLILIVNENWKDAVKIYQITV